MESSKQGMHTAKRASIIQEREVGCYRDCAQKERINTLKSNKTQTKSYVIIPKQRPA